MATLKQVASRIQDLFEQNYTTNASFLDLDDFKFWVSTTYSSMLNALMQSERRFNKQVDGFANIEIPAQWLLEEVVKVKYDEKKGKTYAELCQPVFAFDYDNFAYALQDVEGVGCPHCKYRKISLNEVKFLGIIPPTSTVFYHLHTAKEVVFCQGKEGDVVKVRFVPQIVGQNDDCLLSDNIVSILSDEVLKRMFSAENGNFIDKINDQNPNVVPQQQVNPSVK